jgi:hypothetical protein
MKPKISVELTITGSELDHGEITHIVGRTATRTWREADSIQETALKYKCDGWTLATPEIEDVDMPSVAAEFLQPIVSCGDRLVEVCKRKCYDVEISFIAYVSDEVPILCFGPDIIRMVSQLGAWLDVDLILTELDE